MVTFSNTQQVLQLSPVWIVTKHLVFVCLQWMQLADVVFRLNEVEDSEHDKPGLTSLTPCRRQLPEFQPRMTAGPRGPRGPRPGGSANCDQTLGFIGMESKAISHKTMVVE